MNKAIKEKIVQKFWAFHRNCFSQFKYEMIFNYY